MTLARARSGVADPCRGLAYGYGPTRIEETAEGQG